MDWLLLYAEIVRSVTMIVLDELARYITAEVRRLGLCGRVAVGRGVFKRHPELSKCVAEKTERNRARAI